MTPAQWIHALGLCSILNCAAAHRTSANETFGVQLSKGTPWEGLVQYEELLGEGAFGRVSLAKLKEPCQGKVAIKELPIQCTRRFVKQEKQEIAALKDLQHPNIIQLYAVYPPDPEQWCNSDDRPKNLLLMTELAAGREVHMNMKDYRAKTKTTMLDRLLGRLSKRRDMKIKMVMMMLVDGLRGLSYLHEKGYVHRDLKPANFWEVTNDASCVERLECHFIIGDLGLAVKIPDREEWINSASGTPFYQPQEVKIHGRWYPEGDVWALSAAIIAQLSGLSEDWLEIFYYNHVTTDSQVLDESEVVRSKDYIPPKVAKLLLDMHTNDVSKRPSSSEALHRAEILFEEFYGHAKARRPDATPECIKQCEAAACESFCTLSEGSVACSDETTIS